MRDQLARLALAKAFDPASMQLGEALRRRPIDETPLTRYAEALPGRLPNPSERRRWLTAPESLEPQWRPLAAQGWRWLALGDEDYPPLLADLPDAPGVLAVLGEVSALTRPQIAMVGARGASAEGEANAYRFSRCLAAAGFAVTSGLALGVDGAAHRGALAAPGITLAVLGHGPGKLYPPRHRRLAGEIIAAGGALVSEFAPGRPPSRRSFPQRNRLISGLSLGVVVVEAALRSGSLITARCAAEQGREVFAIPGSIHNPLSKGCHKLLREGANWLECTDDVLAAFEDFHRTVAHSPSLSKPTPPLLRYFIGGVNSLDQLCERSGLAPPELTAALLELEREGHIERVGGGYVSRPPG
ncbi:DNA-processing protein DprA [Alloalcanivorax xenomutans]|uniref:DNA-processing protein DprA n=1 Tax=Alloalcanivorax xenomutans TaxID=1094342 RepID=UPI0024E1F1EE|nr:DNA-processing protein DprA [Alloalcanivorax xenomutans]WOD28579.1 DNA-processing protein DprA [Alloalcanivorax xenomutans]